MSGDGFPVLSIPPRQYNRCSTSCEVPEKAALPPLVETQGYPRRQFHEYATLRPIGLTELRRIDHKHGTAEFGILIGEKDCWHKGYGTEVTRLILDYGFTVENLHNITLDTASYNEPAIRAYTRAGFRIIGRRREVLLWGNKRYDIVLMDCLASEFETPLKRILTLP